MASRLDDIRNRTREKHRKKKEEERRKQEEQQKALAKQAQHQTSNAIATDNKNGYSRIYGDYGWQWIKVSSSNGNNAVASSNSDVDTQQTLNSEAARQPVARRSLDNDFEGPVAKATTNDTWLTTRPAVPASGPISYVSNMATASPLSDVTCSQSPSKLGKVSFTEPVDENDPLAVMKRLAAQKKNKDNNKVANSPESDSSVQNKVGLPPRPNDPSDPMEVSRRLSREKNKDPLEVARIKEEEKRLKQQDEGDSDNEEETHPMEAKNPIALMERNNQGRRSFSPQSREPDNGGWQRASGSNLWDDSEDEYAKPKAKRKSAATREKNGETRKEAAKKKGSRKAASRPLDYDDDDEINSEIERDESLIPSFDNPKMGPPSLMQPLKLPKGSNQKIAHEVPASINRYLRAYQQQGVIFLYSCVMRGTGAILGDDM